MTSMEKKDSNVSFFNFVAGGGGTGGSGFEGFHFGGFGGHSGTSFKHAEDIF